MALSPRPTKGQVNGYDQFEAWATDVERLAEAAFPIKGELLEVDLNTVLTAGVYRQSSGATASKVKNYPADGNTGILEVFVRSGQEIIQRWTAHSGLGALSGIWIRRASGGAWTEWNFLPRQRVDTTAGRAFYTWDQISNREQLLAVSDTGPRNIAALFTAFDFATAGHGATLRRQGYNVTLEFRGKFVAATDFMIPAGFGGKVIAARQQFSSDSMNPVTHAALIDSSRIWGPTLVVGTTYTGRFAWDTGVAWPTVLPGTAIGTIPSL